MTSWERSKVLYISDFFVELFCKDRQGWEKAEDKGLYFGTLHCENLSVMLRNTNWSACLHVFQGWVLGIDKSSYYELLVLSY